MTSAPFTARARALTTERGQLCVGIDPHPALLQAWGLQVSGAGAERFGRTVVEALGDRVAVFKPQSGLFEPFGSAGVAALEAILADIAQVGALSVMDAKRGDIGSTMAGYAQAYLADGSPLASDALTVSGYLGYESLRPAIDLAGQNGRALFVLCRTSNPEGGQVQLAQTGDGSVAQTMIEAAQQDNLAGSDHVGLVVGATHTRLDIDLTGFSGPILVPGIGAQGGTISSLAQGLGQGSGVVLPSASREVLAAGPQAEALRAAVEQIYQS